MQSDGPNADAYQNRKRKILAGSRLFQVQGLCGELKRIGEGNAMWVVVFFLVGFLGLGLLSGYLFGGLLRILLIYAAVMVPAIGGLLDALPEPRLYRPLLREGRLEPYSSSNNTEAWLNFRPSFNREFLINGYRDLMKSLSEPRYYYQRIRTFLERQKPCGPRLGLSCPHFRPFSRRWIRPQATQGAPAL